MKKFDFVSKLNEYTLSVSALESSYRDSDNEEVNSAKKELVDYVSSLEGTLANLKPILEYDLEQAEFEDDIESYFAHQQWGEIKNTLRKAIEITESLENKNEKPT